ncbi:zf-HC2 domain-containing protein [Clostridium tarantellae]|uniref:Putative zinc-finger domain-containing protein n=1 Tax=Clostridium tarantellae TaxID=39493 RepID=A0A6I1MJU7_9CLOT|nr:zf-HC2 domain-containing protein [Clostridium tarantellae]MPQ42688.1 hypothetical protein [Clostridium tarantellae]
MKLNCELVKDLYVLYEENELSEITKESIKEHLKECSKCSNIYKSGDFLNNELNYSLEDISSKTDKKLLLTLKVNKLKRLIYSIIIAILIALLLIYFNNRRNLTKDLNYFSNAISNLNSWVGYQPNEPISPSNYIVSVNSQINNINREYSMVYRNLNLFEKNQIKENYNGHINRDINSINLINTDVVTIMTMLNEKLNLNAFTSKDEELSLKLSNLLLNLEQAVQNSSKKTSKKLFANTEKLKTALNELNNFATSYVNYNKSYEELSFLSKRQIEEKLKNIFGTIIKNIMVKDTSSPFNYNFEIIFLNQTKLVGEIDSVLGRIISLNSEFNENFSKEIILSPNQAEKWVKDIIIKNFNNEFDVNIEYLGENLGVTNHTDKESHYYNFNIQPKFNGYNIFSSINPIINGYTGELDLYSKPLKYKDKFYMLASPDNLKVDVEYSKEEALNQLISNDSSKCNYIYINTIFIPSLLTNNYELVHYYIDKTNKDKPLLFINTSTGKEDFISLISNYKYSF